MAIGALVPMALHLSAKILSPNGDRKNCVFVFSFFCIFASFFENCFTQRWPAKWSRTDCLLIKLSRIYRLRFRNGPQRHTFGEKIKQLQGCWNLFFVSQLICKRSGMFLERRKIAVITFLMSSDMVQCTRSQVAAKIMINSAIFPHRAFTPNPSFASLTMSK